MFIGTTPCPACVARMILHSSFGDHVLTSSWDPPPPPFFICWCQLGPILPPNLGPKSTQHRFKSLPKSIQNRIRFLIHVLIDCWCICDRFSTPKSMKQFTKIYQKVNPNSPTAKIAKSMKNKKLATVFDTSAISCCVKKSIKIVPRSLQKQLSNQHSNLHRF